MELKNIESFIRVAEMGSFTRAAEKMGYSQSTISFQIRQLEEQLGTPLFERVHHSIRLTAKGSEILALAHKVMALTGDMVKIADETRPLTGRLRIAMADSLCQWLFRNDFEAFHREYPDISLKVTTASTEEMFRLLNQNEADLVYTLDKHIYHPRYVIAFEKKVDIHFVAAPSHPLCGRNSVTFEELLAYPMLLTEKGMSYRNQFDEELAIRYRTVSPFLEIGDTTLICGLLEKGLGISFLPDYVTEASVAQNRLRRLPVSDFSADVWIQLLYHRDKWCTPEMSCVIEYLR